MSDLALGYVVNLLARREYSEFELRHKMQAKAFSDEEIEQALARCRQRNWQSDTRFTENYVYARSQRGYGVNRIRQELKYLKGVADDVIDEVLQASDIDWTAVALKTLRKKFPDHGRKPTPKIRQKMWNYMLSHGFYAEEFADFIGHGDADNYADDV